MVLDALDQQIVGLLMEDARATYVQIGERVGLSAPAVERISSEPFVVRTKSEIVLSRLIDRHGAGPAPCLIRAARPPRRPSHERPAALLNSQVIYSRV